MILSVGCGKELDASIIARIIACVLVVEPLANPKRPSAECCVIFKCYELFALASFSVLVSVYAFKLWIVGSSELSVGDRVLVGGCG